MAFGMACGGAWDRGGGGDAGVGRRMGAGDGLGRGVGACRAAPQDLHTGLAICTNPHLGHFVPNMTTLPPARVRTIPGGGSLP